MSIPKWYIIAKNEYRLVLNKIRKIKPYFPYITSILLVIYIIFVAPALADPIINAFDIPAFFISQIASALMQVILFMFFLYFLLFPITTTLKDVNSKEFEIFIKTPIRPSEVLLGKFLGVAPLYSVGIIIIVGFLTAFLRPLGMNLLQISIIIITFVITLISAIWVGTVIANLLRTKLGKTARGTDIGKALSFLIALPLIGVMYAIIGGGLPEALSDPNTSGIVKYSLMIFPSSWGADILMLFTNHPGTFSGIIYDTVLRFGGLIVFFIGSLYVGVKLADRIFTLEQVTFTAAKANPDGAFYNSMRRLGGGRSFGTLLVSIFKDYGRRFENLSKIIYIVGILFLIRILITDIEGAFESIIMGIMIFPLLSALVLGEVTIRGKENLFIYKKAPIGEGRYLLARIFQGWIVVVPIAVTYTIINMILIPGTSLKTMVLYTVLLSLYVAGTVLFALGLFLLMPVFTDKPAELFVNIQIMIMVSIGLFIGSQILFGESMALYALVVIMWILGSIVLFLGKLKLEKIE